jgi:PAS domain S-box-containing protein
MGDAEKKQWRFTVRWSLNRNVTAGLVAALLILAATGFVSYRSTGQLIKKSRQVTHSRQVVETLDEVLVTMADAQTGQSSYLLTRNESDFENYKAAISRLPGILNRLDRLIANDRAQRPNTALLAGLVRAKQVELATANRLLKANQSAVLSSLVLAGHAKMRMEDVRALIEQMEDHEKNLMAAHNAEWDVSARRTTRLVVFGIAVAFIFLLAAILALNNETTERFRAEEALRGSEEHTRLLVGSIQDYAIMMLDPEGVVVSWNPGAERILGYQEKEIVGQHFSILFPGEDGVEGTPQKELETAIVSGRAEEEGWRVRKDGSRFWGYGVVTAIRGDDGRLQGFSKITHDFTERKTVQEEIEKLNRSLEHRAGELETANRELEAFTYSVSHDLRAPLRHIDGFSQLLVDEHGPRLPETVQRYLDRIQAGARQMGQLVDELLNLSRIGRKETRLQVTGLDAVVEQVVSELRSELNGRKIEWKIASLPYVECDPTLVKQVFANLLSNAVKYTRPRSPAVIEVGSEPNNGHPAIFVRDNGVGFSMKYADKLFGVFQRLHRAEDFEGTGIGLATVQRIIHKHGGRIWATAELDKGATFYFTLGSRAN